MEGGCGEGQIERALLNRPLLKRAGIDVSIRVGRQILVRNSRKLLAKLDTEQLVASPGKWNGRDAGSATNLKNASTVRDARQRHDIVEQLLRITGPDFVIENGVPVERGA